MALNFDKYAQEGNLFVKNLAKALGHPDETGRSGIVLRAVLHTLRGRISIGESLNLISQFPLFLKGIYVDNWKYSENPVQVKSIEDFTAEVENHQKHYGEQQFNWEKSTEEIVKIVIRELGKYISEGEFNDIIAQMPANLKDFLRESIHFQSH